MGIYKFITISESTTVCNYQPLGKPGGFGRVYKVTMSDGRIYAGKVFHDHIVAGRENFEKCLQREIAILRRCNYKHVVRYYGSCFHHQLSNAPILLLELMDIDFQEYYISTSDLNLHKIVEILVQVARGLVYLHTRQPDVVIHRDLSARNVLLDLKSSPPLAKITDFGNSRVVESVSTVVTMSQILGTRYYLAPEVDHYRPHYNVNIDVFSFGHLALVGAIQQVITSLPDVRCRDPTDSNKLIARTEVQIREEYFEVLQKRIGQETSFESLVKACLSLDGERRPSAQDLVHKLENILDEPCEDFKYEDENDYANGSSVQSTDSSRGRMIN